MHRRIGWGAATLLVGAALFLAAHGFACYHFRAALQSLDRDLYTDARSHLSWCAVVWPRSFTVKLIEARVERLDGRFDLCEANLQEATVIHGGASEDTQLEFLLLRCQRGELDVVAPGLVNAVENGQADPDVVFLTIGRTLAAQGRFGEALLVVDLWQQHQPDTPAALDLRGYITSILNHKTDAVQCYSRALQLDPGRYGARIRLVDLLLDVLNTQAAEEHIHHLKKTQPNNLNVKCATARYLFLVGKTDEACVLLDRIYEDDPQVIPALLTRAKVELQRGQPAESEKWCRRTLAINRCDPDAHYLLYRSLKAQDGRVSEAQHHLARHEQIMGAYQKIYGILESTKRKPIQDATGLMALGALYLEVGDDARGLQLLYAVLRAEPNHRAANNALAVYFEGKNELDKAKRHRLAAR